VSVATRMYGGKVEQYPPIAVLTFACSNVERVSNAINVIGCRSKTELRAVERFLLRFQVIKLSVQILDTAVDLFRRYRLRHGLLVSNELIVTAALSQDTPP